jgi:hypothetical protein
MNPQYDNAAGGNSGASSTLTISHTMGTSVNSVLIFGVVYYGLATAGVSWVSTTYAGQNMSPIYQMVQLGNSPNLYADFYYMVNPPSGANNIVVTLNGNIQYTMTGASQSYTLTGTNNFGANPTNLLGNPGVGNNNAVTLNGVPHNSTVVGFAAIDPTSGGNFDVGTRGNIVLTGSGSGPTDKTQVYGYDSGATGVSGSVSIGFVTGVNTQFRQAFVIALPPLSFTGQVIIM